MNACEKANIQLIVNFHGADISVHAVLEEYKERYLKLFKIAKVVIGVSKIMCEKLETLGCDKNKFLYLPCHPDPKFFNLATNLQSKNLLAVGRFVDKKNPVLNIACF